jgi:hypothetical protein
MDPTEISCEVVDLVEMVQDCFLMEAFILALSNLRDVFSKR